MAFEMVLLLASAVLVGVFVGAVGIGGVLLIPALMIFSGLTIHQAAATALFTFLFTGILGTWLFTRRGTIDWRTSVPVCAGALPSSFVGAVLGGVVPATILVWIVALILVAAGLYILLPRASATPDPGEARFTGRALLGAGAVSGFGAGISGAGGPLFSVPIMLAMQFDPLIAVGTGQVVQIASSLSGSLGNVAHETIQYGLSGPVTLAELLGVALGVKIAHAVEARHLRTGAAVLCIASAIGMLAKHLFT